jgi:sterol desaturase/sphingolipid hydroxylase (fatty acid hydroxylase superfamily)
MQFLQAMLPVIWHATLVLGIWFCVFFLVFTFLWRLQPCNPEHGWWRKDTLTDVAYFFLMPVGTRFIRIFFITGGMYLFLRGQSKETLIHFVQHGYGPLSRIPIWAQAVIVFVLQDVILYWTHRLFHIKALWPFHAIHHSPTEVDWLSAFRFHPVNMWFTFTLVDTLMLFIGFSPDAVTVMAGLNMSYSAMVHANLNWTFGRFRYVLASPVFHRWHHTAEEEGMDKNFAPTFPFVDVLFGTFFMPMDRKPDHYGVAETDMPRTFLGQMIWPFRRRRAGR